MEPPPLFSRVSDASNGRPASVYPPPRVIRDRYWLHLLLFALTLLSTAFTGSQFIGRTIAWEQGEAFFYLLGFPVTWPFIRDGLTFAVSLLGFLTVHEFGHYFAARYHRVKTSLPYFIPSPLIGIGTLGAVIRIREQVPNLRKLFDIGAAGPLAGFVVALGVVIYALATLPPPAEFMQSVGGHEALKAFIDQNGRFPGEMLPGPPESEGFRLVVGNTPLYWGLSQLFANVPPMYEMYHHPMLFAGWLGLFFTALNLLPVAAAGDTLQYTVDPLDVPDIEAGVILVRIPSWMDASANVAPAASGRFFVELPETRLQAPAAGALTGEAQLTTISVALDPVGDAVLTNVPGDLSVTAFLHAAATWNNQPQTLLRVSRQVVWLQNLLDDLKFVGGTWLDSDQHRFSDEAAAVSKFESLRAKLVDHRYDRVTLVLHALVRGSISAGGDGQQDEDAKRVQLLFCSVCMFAHRHTWVRSQVPPSPITMTPSSIFHVSPVVCI